MNDVNNLLGNVGKILEAAPQIYDDALKSTVQETGKIICRIPRTINAIFANWEKWLLGKEYNVKMTEKLLE